LLSQGTVSISFPNSTTAQANAGGWAFCNDPVLGYQYSWSTGSTGPTTGVSAGQVVSVTVWACTDLNGCTAPAVTSATAPGGGGGGTPPVVQLSILSPNPMAAGQAAVLQLASNGASCTAGGTTLNGIGIATSWSTGGATSGTFSTGILSTGGTYHYTVTCTNATGSTTAGTNPDLTVTGSAPPSDRDGDGVPDPSDNCVDFANADQADHDGDGVGDACDPTPFSDGIVVGPTVLTASQDLAGGSSGALSVGCSAPNRLKYREYRQEFRQRGISLTFLAMTVAYQVCYKQNGGSNAIAWVRVLPAVANYHLVPWSWQNTNDGGFPSGANLGGSARMRWQGSAAICAFHYACGPSVHPAVGITFSAATNTEVISASVG
jgi:hypothetical protein